MNELFIYLMDTHCIYCDTEWHYGSTTSRKH